MATMELPGTETTRSPLAASRSKSPVSLLASVSVNVFWSTKTRSPACWTATFAKLLPVFPKPATPLATMVIKPELLIWVPTVWEIAPPDCRVKSVAVVLPKIRLPVDTKPTVTA